MAIYTFFEEEADMLKLYKKYPEENLEMLFRYLFFIINKETIRKLKGIWIKSIRQIHTL